MAALKEIDVPFVLSGYRNWNIIETVLGLANGDILSLTTVLGTSSSTSLEGKLLSKTPAEQYVPMQKQFAASLRGLKAVSELGFTDVAIAAANDLAGVRAIFTTALTGETTGDRGIFMPTIQGLTAG